MNPFAQACHRRVLFLDGAMGTAIHSLPHLDLEKDYLGRENCTEVLLLTRPELIQSIHESFLAVGCDAVETDSFNANVHTMADQDLTDRVFELNRTAAEVARAACDKFTTSDKPRFVVGSMGPGTRLISLGQIDWDTMAASYAEQVRGLLAGGADALLIETAQDILQVKCAVNAALEVLKGKNLTPCVDATSGGSGGVPIMVQVTIEQFGTTLIGTDIAGVVAALRGYPIFSLGLNCATGPVEMSEHLHYLSANWHKPISLLPNAGIPSLVNGETVFPLQPQPFAEKMAEYVRTLGINIVGGCCGTTPDHIARLIEAVGRDVAPAEITKKPWKPSLSSLMGAVEYRQDASILNIGERTNASGSRKFKQLLENEDWDEIMSLAREMVREGSHIIDVNVDYAGRDNAADMRTIVSKLVNQVNAPLMLDSTQPATIEAGLKAAGGKCIINSANLEDGEEKFARLCALAKKYNAGLVLGSIDEDPQEAMARTATRKLAIAERMHQLATEKYGLDESDILFDPLVLPISTGMEKDRRSALETIEGVRRIAQRFPNCQITCGLSNVSFGLLPAARQVLNSVFLHELVEAGLTSAILHVSKILPRNRIPDNQWNAARNLIYNRPPEGGNKLADGSMSIDPLQIFIDLFPADAAAQSARDDLAQLPLEQRMRRHIIDGEKKNLAATLDEALQQYSALDIINDHLLDGMKTVGELFGSGQMQLPFVLQSAEVMKQAVSHLEPHMEKHTSGGGKGKGQIVLATVRGDVHDIGKNLVDIILTNNGYTVHNLGIKVHVNQIIDTYRQTGADAIGLSGLLVKSVNVMQENIEELNEQDVTCPVILGGAALSRHYCESHLRNIYRGKVYHGTDAFEGLRIMDQLKAGKAAQLDAEIAQRLQKRAATDEKLAQMQSKQAPAEGASAPVLEKVVPPTPPFLGSRVVESVPLDDIYPYINTVALFRGQWQFRKQKLSDAEYEQLLAEKVQPLFEHYKARLRDESVLQPRVVYGYYPCRSQGNDLIIYAPDDPHREIERFTWPRQQGRQHLCVADFFRSVNDSDKQADVIGLSCVTMGSEVSRLAQQLYKQNNYTEYLYVHGMGVECAEALAEYWHKRMRTELGIDGDDSPDVRQLFTQHYRGSRYSFGYPAVPDLSDQAILFRLLDPARIGCTLTENHQIDPEQSTSAIIVHHPQAKYFNV
ncbi:MAG: methionine synthase [Phycisphaeraceae bacterium]|nr:methionine synthase [Phycisphaeraceae bacterium]